MWKQRRLFLFIYVVDVIQQNEDQTDNSQYITKFKLHLHHLPSSGRQKEIFMHSRQREATATVYGALRISFDIDAIISQFYFFVNTES